MAHKLLVLEWLYKAEQDFGFAKVNLEEEWEYFDQICLFFHQAAEKYLKAYIVKFGLRFEKQHDLLKLLKTCSHYDPSFKKLQEDCRFLNPFYIEIRYPDVTFVSCTQGQAKEAYSRAKKIRDFVKKKLGVTREITLEELKKENERIDRILRKI